MSAGTVSRTLAKIKQRGAARLEAGDTLVEVLLALVVLAMATVAILIALTTTIGASAEHRNLATYDNVLTVASQGLISSIQGQPSLFTNACSTPITSYPTVSLPSPYNSGQYSVQISQIWYWQPGSSSFGSNCVADEPQLITVTLTVNGSATTYSNSFVVDYSVGSASGVAATGSAAQLVFLINPSGGYAGSPLGTQPVVAVENGSGQVVQSDLSMVSLTLTPTSGSGTLSGCSGTEILGVITFQGCTIGAGGSYQIVATDFNPSNPSNPAVAPATSPVFTVSPSSFKLVFTSQPSAGQSGGTFNRSAVVAVQNSSGSTNTSWNGSITFTTSGGVLSNCPSTSGLTAATSTSVTIQAVGGIVSLPSGCDFAGGYFYNPNSSPQTTATQYTMTAVASPTGSSGSVVPASSNAFSVTGPGSPTQLAFTIEPVGVASADSTDAFAGTPQAAVTLADSFGNVVYNISNPPSVSLQLMQVVNGSNVRITNYPQNCHSSQSNGTYSFSGCNGQHYGTGYTLVATTTTSTGTLLTATSTAFNITNVASNLAFTVSPVAGSSASAFIVQPVLEVTDTNGYAVTAFSTPISNYWSTTTSPTAPSGGQLTSCTGLVPNLGFYNLATCTFAGLVGTPYTMSVTVPGLPPVAGNLPGNPTAVSATFTPTDPGPATQLIFTTPPVAAASGSPLSTQPIISVEDSAGNVVTSSSLTVSLSLTGGPPTGALNGCTGLTAASGVVNASNCALGGKVATSYTLTASAGDLTPATTTISPTGPGPATQVILQGTGCAAGIYASVSPPTSLTPTTCTATATIEDAYTNVESGDSSSVVTFSAPTGPGSVTGLGSVTVSSGVATSTLTGGNVGSVTIGASVNSLVSNPLTFNVTAVPQVITWTAPGPQTWVPGGAGTFSLGTASDSSSSAVTFTATAGSSSVCTVSGTTVTMVNAGTCSIYPTVLAFGNWAATTGATQVITINPAAQPVAFYEPGSNPLVPLSPSSATITYSPSGTYQTFALGGAGGVGGGNVKYSISLSTTPANTCSVNSSGLVAIQSAGTCVVNASAAANTDYVASTVPATFTLTISKADQPVSFYKSNLSTQVSGDSTAYSPSGTYQTLALGGAGGIDGGIIAYSISSSMTPANTCSVNSSGLVTIQSAGTCVVNASAAATGGYYASTAPAIFTLTISMADQPVAFYEPGSTPPVLLSPSGANLAYSPSSTYQTLALGGAGGVGGGNVKYSISSSTMPANTCSVNSSGLVTIQSAGICLVNASAAATSNYYTSTAPATFTLTSYTGHPTLVGSTFATNGHSSGSTKITLSQPSGTQVGDLLIAILYTGDNTTRHGGGDPSTVTPPNIGVWQLVGCATSGGACSAPNSPSTAVPFNFLSSGNKNGTNDKYGAIVTYETTATSQNPITYTFNSGNTGNFNYASAVLLSYTNSDSTTPVIDQSYWSPSQYTTALTPSTSADTAVAAIGDWNGSSLNLNGSSPWSDSVTTGMNGYSSLLAADQQLVSQTPITSSDPVSQSGSGQGVSVTILLKY